MLQEKIDKNAFDQKLSRTLCDLRRRCNNKKAHNWKWYGGKGVKALITKEELEYLWNRDKGFDMKCPSIDRIDSNGSYELSNCRWIERYDNAKQTMFKSGLKNPRHYARLTPAKIKKIRKWRKEQKFHPIVLARMFNVAYKTIRDVYCGHTWKHVV